MPRTDPELPFFVYGTLLPGEPNHDLFLRDRAIAEQPALLPGALLYEGPGYPYAIEGHGTVRGTLVTAAPAVYAELLVLLDRLEEYAGPGHPRNLYERVARRSASRARSRPPPEPPAPGSTSQPPPSPAPSGPAASPSPEAIGSPGGRLHPHRAHLELRHPRHRVQRRVRQRVGPALTRPVERHEDGVLPDRTGDPGGRHRPPAP